MVFNMPANRTSFIVACVGPALLCAHALADPPPGYYDPVDATNATTLRATLHEVIDDHLRFPYTSGNTDTWDILNLAEEDGHRHIARAPDREQAVVHLEMLIGYPLDE